MTDMPRAIVIGAGIAGIAASIRLANRGYEVVVLEANNYAGGKLTTIQDKGYRFDAGPSLFTMPHMVDELFTLCGENPRDHFNYQRQGSLCNYFWNDGKHYQMPADVNDIAKSMSSDFDIDAKTVSTYLSKGKLKYDKTRPVFLERSLHKFSSFTNTETLSAIASIPKLDINSTLHEVNKSTFKDEKLVQLFDRYATYNGSSPYQTPGIMSMIPHLEMGIGTYFPAGGMISITESLLALAERQGVQFRFDTKVSNVTIENNVATGVTIDNDTMAADVVISNMDVFSTYTHLLPKKYWLEKTLSQEQSSSALIFYWGVSTTFSELDLHNIFFADDYEGEFQQIFQSKTITDDPTIYINISSKCNPSDAPPESENWFVMINTPGDYGQDWDHLISEARKNIINKIDKLLGVQLEDLIETESVLDPRQIQSKTQSHRGALYGTASNSKFAAFLRHPNFSKQIDQLYFCGGSVHPGGGIPLCLHSAQIVADLVPSPSYNL